MRTLATGCGRTTILFVLAQTDRCSLTSNKRETELVAEYCVRIGLSVDRLHFRIGSSAALFPTMLKEPPLDFIYNDRSHTFPFSNVDFYYAEQRLSVGGVLGIDDCQIRAVRVLYDHLSVCETYERRCHVDDAAFFRKISDAPSKEWKYQAFNRLQKHCLRLPLLGA
jgi:hypothetical protein